MNSQKMVVELRHSAGSRAISQIDSSVFSSKTTSLPGSQSPEVFRRGVDYPHCSLTFLFVTSLRILSQTLGSLQMTPHIPKQIKPWISSQKNYPMPTCIWKL